MSSSLEDQILECVASGNAPELAALLDSGASADFTIRDRPILVAAAHHGHLSVVQLLIKRGANVNIADPQGATALMWASHNGHIEIVKLLLASGADIKATNNGGFTAYEYAESNRQDSIQKLLWRIGGRPGKPRTVLVLGAGFTKSFFPTAPLLVDDYGIEGLVRGRYQQFPAAKSVLEAEIRRSEIERYPKGYVNLERLMTRLAVGMPYDSAQQDMPILAALLADLQETFVKRIDRVRGSVADDVIADLRAFAKYCILSETRIITFNYDDLLDEALESQCRRVPGPTAANPLHHGWHPNSGYGFECRHAKRLIEPQGSEWHTPVKIELLKLHGSMNWRVLKGSASPYRIGDIYHDEIWSEGQENRHLDDIYENISERIEDHLEPEPLLVPPVLTKQTLALNLCLD